MKNNKGITLVSLVIYIAVVMVVAATVIRITTYFRNNMTDVADVSFETEFQKINLYLLDESKTIGNGIDEITNETEIIFKNGNKYNYIASDKTIYLNDTIKVCENVESCTFSEKTAENRKSVIVLEIKISGTTRTMEYVMQTVGVQNNEVDIDDYLIGVSRVTYYLKAGDYVDYTPDTGIYKVADGEYGSGYTTTEGYQTFTTEVNDEEAGTTALKWRVFSIDEETGEIELIAATVTKTKLYLEYVEGYNHGVDILNDLCEALYSKTVNGRKVAIARSINVEDINSKTTYNPKIDANYSTLYGTEIKYSSKGNTNRKYPNLCEKEDGFYIGGIKQTGGINQSEGLADGIIDENGITTYSTVTNFTDDYNSETGNAKKDISVTNSYYTYNIEDYLNTNLGINTVGMDLFGNSLWHWIASRGINDESNLARFFIRTMGSNSKVSVKNLFNSSTGMASYGAPIRPIVTLDATQYLDFTVGDGSEENPWGMK